jgi:hypothetical protein
MYSKQRRRPRGVLRLEQLERRDCPATVSISGGRDVTEGTAGIALQVTLSEPLATKASVVLSTAGSTATSADYSLAPYLPRGVLVFQPGETSKTLTLSARQDVFREPTERVLISLTRPTNCTVATTSATVRILDDDSYSVSMKGPVSSVSAGQLADVSIQLSAPATKNESFWLTTINGSAKARTDFIPLSRRVLTVPRGATSAKLQIPILVSGTTAKTFVVSAVSATRGTPSPSPVRVAIKTAAPPPILTVANTSLAEGNPGPTNTAVFTLSLSAACPNAVTVSYQTADGSANSQDYTARSGIITFAPGQTVMQVNIPVTGDSVFEADESFSLVLSAPSNCTLGNSSATATILNDDPAPLPGISIDNTSVLEGNSGTAIASFLLSLSFASSSAVTVNYATSNGTATSEDGDYVPRAGTVTFAAGETSKSVAVPISGDTKPEPNEAFSLTLSAPVNCTLARPSGEATIIDDDVDQPGFQITVNYIDSVPAVIRDTVAAAVAGWQQVITGDIPSVIDPFTGELVDDIVLDVRVGLLGGATPTGSDGVENALANAGMIFGARAGADGTLAIRRQSGLPFHATIGFDPSDFPTNSVTALRLFYTTIHEIGHALGFGQLWNYDPSVGLVPQSGLITGFGTQWPLYVGVNAVREYNAVFGTTGSSMPVENTAIQGTYGLHWNEAIMGAEIMTSVTDSGVKCPFSRITIGAMQDLGYVVNYDAADAYASYGFIEWNQSAGGNGHAYALFKDRVSWPEARRMAESLIPPTGFRRGTLVSINSDAENQFLASWVPSATWMGFTDEVVDGEWRWIDGSPGVWQDPANFRNPVQTTYVNWSPGEPSSYYLTYPENYGLFRWGSDKWNDGVGPVGGLPFPFVVEFVQL